MRCFVMRASRMTADPAIKANDQFTYTYRPSVLGSPRAFKLTGDDIEWSTGRNSGRIPFRKVRRLRMSFKPSNMQAYRFLTEVWADGAPKLEIVSSSWKSLVEQERLDNSYSAFVAELHRRIAVAAMPVRYEQGRNPLLYWPGFIAFVGVAIGLAGLIVRALQGDVFGGAAFIGVFLVVFLWQGGNFVRRNRPGVYRPEALPPELMP
jgi:hypothetical protein